MQEVGGTNRHPETGRPREKEREAEIVTEKHGKERQRT